MRTDSYTGPARSNGSFGLFLPCGLVAAGRLLAGLALGTFIAGPASAGAPGYDWSGSYLGGYVSFNQGKLDTEGDVTHLSTDEDDVPLLGIFGGHRWNIGNDLVAGIAIEVPLWAEEDGAEDVTFYPSPAFDPPVTYDYDIDYAVLIMGQIGRSYGRWLPYVEGGVGRLGATYRVNNVDNSDAYSPGFVQKTSNDHWIWKAGVGLDYAIDENLVVGAKLSYIKSNQESYDVPWLAPPPSNIGAESVSAYFSLAWMFD